MDDKTATVVLRREIDRLRALPYADLRARFPTPVGRRSILLGLIKVDVYEGEDLGSVSRIHTLPGGEECDIESEVWWDGEEGEDIRVSVAVSYWAGSERREVREDFIMAPNGSFVGE